MTDKLSDAKIAEMVRAEFSRPAAEPVKSDQDAFDFFADSPTPAKNDVLGKIQVVMFLIASVGLVVSVVLATQHSPWAIVISLPSLALSILMIVIATVSTPK